MHLLGGIKVGKGGEPVGGKVGMVGGQIEQHRPGGVVGLSQSGRRQRITAQSTLKYGHSQLGRCTNNIP